MPALPPVPNVLLFVLKMTLGDDADVVNRFHVGFSGVSPSDTQLDLVAGDTAGGWNTNLAPNAHGDLALREITVTDLTSPTSAVGTWTGDFGGTGTTGENIGAGSAMRINRNIARRYRGGRPGVFWPLTSSAYISSPQDINGAYVLAMESAWPDFELSAVGSCTARFATDARSVSVSYYEGNTQFLMPSGRYRTIPKLRPGGPLVENLTSITINPRVASQRRRNLTRA